jgi:hypothetical protein
MPASIGLSFGSLVPMNLAIRIRSGPWTRYSVRKLAGLVKDRRSSGRKVT